MDHEAATITDIDPFGGSPEHATQGHEISHLEEQFWHNVSLSNYPSKLRQLKGPSSERLIQLRPEKAQFDLIYIDGSHTAVDVLEDAVLSWSMLKEGATLVFDDDYWKVYKQDVYSPKLAIDSFFEMRRPNGAMVRSKRPGLGTEDCKPLSCRAS